MKRRPNTHLKYFKRFKIPFTHEISKRRINQEMSQFMKKQNIYDENSLLLTSKIRKLEKELAEKADLLKRTQREYEVLLSEFEKLKSQVFSINFNNANNSISTKSANFTMNNDISSFDENSNCKYNFNQSLKQLRNVEGNVQNLTLQNLSLQSKIDGLKLDQHEWHNFANSVFTSIREFVYFKKDFPEDDSEAQRFILFDLIQKLKKRCLSDLQDENYAKKYRISKLKLKQVQTKCDKMLQLLGDNGFDVSCFEDQITKRRQSHKSKKKRSDDFNILSESDDNDNFNDFEIRKKINFSDSDDFDCNQMEGSKQAFKEEVKKLASVAHNMKGYYRDYAQLSKKSKKKH